MNTPPNRLLLKPSSPRRQSRALLPRTLLALCLGGLACAARSAELDAAAPVMAATEPAPRAVGDATSQLLALQRSGAAASPVPRPITGDVAARSYQRYLKSFEHPIPERFDTTVGTGSGAGSGTR